MTEDLPVPSRARAGRYSVDLPPISAPKAALYRELRSSGMKKAELARKLGWEKSQVDRLLDLMHKSRLDQLEQALQVFDKVVVLDVKRRPEPRQKIRAAS